MKILGLACSYLRSCYPDKCKNPRFGFWSIIGCFCLTVTEIDGYWPRRGVFRDKRGKAVRKRGGGRGEEKEEVGGGREGK